MSGQTYGYVVDIGDGRAMEDRLEAVRASGVDPEYIITEAKGKNETRPRLKSLLGRVRPGDTLVFESIYGIGHNYNAIAENLQQLNRVGSVCIVLLDMPLLSDRSSNDPLRPVVSEMVMQTVLYMARHQKETRDWQQRQGIETARARGVQFGRPKLAMPEEYERTVERWRNGEITAAEAADLMHISRTTLFRRVKSGISE